MRALDQPERGVAVQAGQADLEPGVEQVAFGLAELEIDFGIDGGFRRQLDAALAGRKAERAFEAGGPAGREQLFRVGAGAPAAGRAELNVEAAVRAACGAVAAADGVDLRGVKGIDALGWVPS